MESSSNIERTQGFGPTDRQKQGMRGTDCCLEAHSLSWLACRKSVGNGFGVASGLEDKRLPWLHAFGNGHPQAHAHAHSFVPTRTGCCPRSLSLSHATGVTDPLRPKRFRHRALQPSERLHTRSNSSNNDCCTRGFGPADPRKIKRRVGRPVV